MAHLVRPWTYRYLKDGQRVPKGTPGAKRVKDRARKWYGADIPGHPPTKRIPLASDKSVAQQMLAELVRKGERKEAGLVTPFDEHEQRPLLDHLDDFRRYLAAKGNTPDHVRKTATRCRVILEGVDAETLADLQPSAVLEWLAAFRQRGAERCELKAGKEWFTKGELAALLAINPASLPRLLKRDGLNGEGNGKARRYSRVVVEALQARLCRGNSVSTSNHYLTAAKNFTHWMVKDRRVPFDPLACLSRQNADADIRVERRALPPPSFAAFLDAARRGKTLRGLNGVDRAVLYVLAARSGFRASELSSLSPASFDFAVPSVTVQAAYSKRRRRDEQPLPPAVAAAMKAYVAGKPRNAPLWPGGWVHAAAEIVRLDLSAAGIPFVDEAGCVYDFHALRHQFITDMVESGVHPKDAQALARHSTITLTMDRYAHVRKVNLQAALAKLPSLTDSANEQQTA